MHIWRGMCILARTRRMENGDIPTGEHSLGGLCRRIILNPPSNCGSDFEGALLFSRDQLTCILEHFRGWFIMVN